MSVQTEEQRRRSETAVGVISIKLELTATVIFTNS